MNFKGKDFITLADFSKEELIYLIELASRLKAETKSGTPHEILKNKTLAMFFSKPSLRTRISFEVGMHQLGGKSYVIKQDEISLGVRESIADTARVLSRYVDGVMIRTFDHSDVLEFAKWADVPVINGLTDISHPCHVMADLLTIKERFNSLEGLKLAYLVDGNNMAHSLMLGCAILGMDVSIGCPQGYEPDKSYIELAQNFAKNSGSKVVVTNQPQEAVHSANVLYTDVWASMGQEAEAEARKKIFYPYQLNFGILKEAAEDVIVLHCLPAHRGEEITEDVLEKYADVIFDEAENRLHAQKAVLASLL